MLLLVDKFSYLVDFNAKAFFVENATDRVFKIVSRLNTVESQYKNGYEPSKTYKNRPQQRQDTIGSSLTISC